MRGRVWIGERGMGEQQLPRREAPAQALGQAGAAAEEGDLETDQAPG